ncbi:MAG: hypothetical protein JWO89_3778 [Verrucomicrobiaceae bacterium]|nr:hypothetical protein [Verrucomicrobiaceae bacterium]
MKSGSLPSRVERWPALRRNMAKRALMLGVVCSLIVLPLEGQVKAELAPPQQTTRTRSALRIIPPFSPAGQPQQQLSRDVHAPDSGLIEPPTGPPIPEGVLQWDEELKEKTVPLGTPKIVFTYHVTNVSTESITVSSVKTSCGCTVAKLPPTPWKIASGTKGTIDVETNLAGKRGVLLKNITVNTDHGFKVLMARINLQESQAGTMSPADRERNLKIATADRQAVLQGECASCHKTPALSKMGHELYQTACSICHDTEHRASNVPDLRHLQKPTNADYWRAWITTSVEGKLMPAFGVGHGGFLTTPQIDSLVNYLVETIPADIPGKSPRAAILQR